MKKNLPAPQPDRRATGALRSRVLFSQLATAALVVEVVVLTVLVGNRIAEQSKAGVVPPPGQVELTEDFSSDELRDPAATTAGWSNEGTLTLPEVAPGQFARQGLARSLEFDLTTDSILSATMNAVFDPAGGVLEFSLSNDGGRTFWPALLGVPVRFSTVGNDLRWSVTLTRSEQTTSAAPLIDSLTVRYATKYASVERIGGTLEQVAADVATRQFPEHDAAAAVVLVGSDPKYAALALHAAISLDAVLAWSEGETFDGVLGTLSTALGGPKVPILIVGPAEDAAAASRALAAAGYTNTETTDATDPTVLSLVVDRYVTRGIVNGPVEAWVVSDGDLLVAGVAAAYAGRTETRSLVLSSAEQLAGTLAQLAAAHPGLARVHVLGASEASPFGQAAGVATAELGLAVQYTPAADGSDLAAQLARTSGGAVAVVTGTTGGPELVVAGVLAGSTDGPLLLAQPRSLPSAATQALKLLGSKLTGTYVVDSAETLDESLLELLRGYL